MMSEWIVVKTDWSGGSPGQFALGPWESREQAENVVECEVFFGVSRDDLLVVEMSGEGRASCAECGAKRPCTACLDPW